jgi:hypothetical protein
MGWNKYGEDEAVAQARSRQEVDRTGYLRREVVDRAMTLDEWRQREVGRSRARGDLSTEAELLGEWDRLYPRKPSVDARIPLGRKAPGDKPAKPAERAQEIGRPTR